MTQINLVGKRAQRVTLLAHAVGLMRSAASFTVWRSAYDLYGRVKAA